MNYWQMSVDVFWKSHTRPERAISCSNHGRLTAMSALSARTSSWGGEGALLGRGGETTGGGATSLVAFFALTKMGASFCTSSSGADDSELSESESMVVVRRC